MSDAVPDASPEPDPSVEPSADPSVDPGVRIGHAERFAAMNALKHHYSAGRISSKEYEERSLTVEKAQTDAETASVFTDLPQPHALNSSELAALTETQAGSETSATGASPVVQTLTPGAPPPEPDPAPNRTPNRGVLSLPEPYATTVVSITPILAVILFFVTHTWLWFLAIPIVALLVYGPDGREGSGPEAAERRRREKN
ncbi:DUF1707 SHOCT-like domain-containing protein [Kineosporia succinea]|uniref:DUF1707 domain-containing protein n=1 Tax=Kineosporia succinea TaxID=84632 RepID=A0ABT9NXM8_9ACTN|nr:DUF1707 domain-containing protein [Kineosporia succinea]MDP9825177.1 hypothetical protein [Kineosporia succinea]